MYTDAQGLEITVASADAAQAYDAVLDGYTRFRADVPQRLGRLLAVDPEAPMAQMLKGAFALLSFNAGNLPVAQESLEAARRLVRAATWREQAHVEALAYWSEGDLDRTLAVWEDILEQHPRDMLAFRFHHFLGFWLGRMARGLTVADRVAPRWSRDAPGYGTLLGCHAFANEECGNYRVAERLGRAAIALDPADPWSAHAVAHVLEMEGRRGEGIRFLDGLEQHWDGANNMKHHLWWHRALFHIERGEFETVLDLYDRRFRNHGSPLTAAMPDVYIDVQNAASILFRLKLRGVGAGARWEELADKAQARTGDCLNPFTLPHWMMALTASGRWDAAGRLLESVQDAGRVNRGTLGPILRDVASPVCEAVLAHARGDHAAAVAAMRPALGILDRMGGSHAQQEVLEQLFLDAAIKGGLEDDARTLLERVAGRFPVPPERRIGYAEAARRVMR